MAFPSRLVRRVINILGKTVIVQRLLARWRRGERSLTEVGRDIPENHTGERKAYEKAA